MAWRLPLYAPIGAWRSCASGAIADLESSRAAGRRQLVADGPRVQPGICGPTNDIGHRRPVFSRHNQPPQVRKVVQELHECANAAYTEFDHFANYTRRRFAL
jgi:hypothetical protein